MPDPRTGPLPLALLRIVVALCWLVLPQVRYAPDLIGLPVLSHPLGIGWLVPWLSVDFAHLAQIVVYGGALLALLGIGARTAFAAVAIAGTYLLAIPQFQGGVQHMHHLVWFAALLAVSPASDALAVGRVRPTPGRSLGWSLPIWVAWTLLATIYFFPGLHKVRVQGLGWAGENLTTLLHWKWAQSWDFVPWFQLDQWPTLLWLGGLGVLALEVGAPLWMLHRWSRLGFAVAALLFHIATAAFFNIHFWILAPFLVVLLPFDRPNGDEVVRPWRPAALVGGVLIVGTAWAGVSNHTQAWPFACYPTFERPIDRWMPGIQIVGVDGERTWIVPEHAMAEPSQSQRFTSEVWGLIGLYGVHDASALERFWKRMERRPEVVRALGESTEVRLLWVMRSVDPGDEEVRAVEELANFER